MYMYTFIYVYVNIYVYRYIWKKSLRANRPDPARFLPSGRAPAPDNIDIYEAWILI